MTRLLLAVATTLAVLSTAIVIPNGVNKDSLSQSQSQSTRKTINFGPNIQSRHESINYALPTDAVSSTATNECLTDAATGTGTPSATTCIGTLLAQSFIKSLHPTLEFTLVNSYLSKHSNVLHAYFVQVINGRPVVNANLNLNLHVPSRTVISYGDSSFTSSPASSFSSRATNDDANADFATSLLSGESSDQIVLSASESRDPATVASSDLPIASSWSSPPLVATHESDPRHGLLTFVSLQSPCPRFTAFVTSSSSARAQLISEMTVVPLSSSSSFDGTEDPTAPFLIENVPTAVQPVKASLVYVHDSESIKLAWKYEIRTLDNEYEAYVSAEGDPALRGNEETLMVVDWVRDYRPTGGEMGLVDFTIMKSNVVKPWSPKKEGRIGHAAASWGKVARTVVEDRAVEEDDTEVGTTPEYKVFPWGTNDPEEGKRQFLKGSLVELDNEASPAGWHAIPSSKGGVDVKKFTDTRGNNVFAQDNPDGGNEYENNYRPSGGKNLSFDFPLGWPKEGKPRDPTTYLDAAITELFYTNNEIHDLFYRYGFDEASGNFQEYNFGRGGRGNDAVQANAQDGSGTNNANFATPPDGQRPRMRMYVWTGAQPYRDGDFEAGIVIHEYAHGISTRLTGGPANSGCLGWGEAGGMGEGWGDFFATMIRMKDENQTEFAMGEWASARKGGIRNFRYSTSTTVNTDSYKTLDQPGYWGVHAIGEVWAEMLFEMAELFIAKHGFHSGLFPPAPNATDSTGFYTTHAKTGLNVPRNGNTLAVQLVVDGLKLQPCRPSFQDARDAILDADRILTGGENACIIWQAFSKRGLGPEAVVIGSTPWGGGVRTEDHSLPKICID